MGVASRGFGAEFGERDARGQEKSGEEKVAGDARTRI